jgi:hypothetical protein
MKQNGLFSRRHWSATAVFALLACIAPISANSIIAGGSVPEWRNLTVTPAPIEPDPGQAGPVEVAEIEIDNNLPDYELVLDFSDRDGGDGRVVDVRLVGFDGILGQGLENPGSATMIPGDAPGRFIWRPGRQGSATLGYRMKVMVTFAGPPSVPSTLMVGMPVSY